MAKRTAVYTWCARQSYMVDGEAILSDPIEVIVLADSRSEALQSAKELLGDSKELYLIKIEER